MDTTPVGRARVPPPVGTRGTSAAVGADAAELVGFDLPPVEQVTGAVEQASQIASNLATVIRGLISTGLATADAVQGRLSAGILAPVRAAIETGKQACQNVHSCVVAETLATIGVVDEYLLTLPIGEPARDAITAEIAAIFGRGRVSGGDGTSASEIEGYPCIKSPSGVVTCEPPGTGEGGNGQPAAGPPPILPPRTPLPGPIPPTTIGGPAVTPDCPVGGTPVFIPGFMGDAPVTFMSAEGGNTIWYTDVDHPYPDHGINAGHPPRVPANYSGILWSCAWLQVPGGAGTIWIKEWVGVTVIPGGQAPPPGPIPPVTTPPPPPPPPPTSCPQCGCCPCQCQPTQPCSGGTLPFLSRGGSQSCKPPKKSQWCVYCRELDRTTYLVEPGEPPELPGDIPLECYDSLEDVPPRDDWPACPVPPLPQGSPGLPTLPSGSVWCTLDVCAALGQWTPGWTGGSDLISEMLGGLGAPLSAVPFPPDLESAPFYIREPFRVIWNLFGSALRMGGTFLAAAAGTAPCPEPQYLSSLILSALVGFAEKYIAPVFGEIDRANQYFRHLACPQLTLDAQQATAAYLGGQIDVDTFRCLVQANNTCWQPWEAYTRSQRARPNPDQLNQLRRRGIIDESDYDLSMRGLGYLDQGDTDNLFALTSQIPFVSDILRMMVRDVADQTLVQQFGMDAQFSQKWVGQLQEWGHQQGVDDLYAQYVWRAHWSIPSPTQLYEMYHRLRDTPPPVGFADWLDVIKTALVQQDILPFWVEPLLAVAFRPLTATDVTRAYAIGSIDFDGMVAAYKQNGYSDENAESLAKFRRRERLLGVRTLPQARLFLDDGLSATDFNKFLLDRNYPPADATEAIAVLDQIKTGTTRKKCVESLRRRYMKGELDVNQLYAGLIGLGLDAPDATNLVQRYQCEFSSRDPHVHVRYIIKLYKSGVIGVQEFLRRTGNLGILPDLAGLMLKQADAELGDQAAARAAKAQRAADRAAAQAAAKAARVARAAARLAQQQARAAQQAQRAAAQEERAAERARKTMDDTIRKAIKLGGGEADVTSALTQAVSDLESTYGMSPNEAIAVVTLAVETLPAWSDAGFEASLQLAIAAHLGELSGTSATESAPPPPIS